MSYEGPWRNRLHDLYTQYAYFDEIPEKLRCVIAYFGSAFDDYWHYRLPKKRKPDTRQVVIRMPLWMDKETAEKGDRKR